MPPFGDLQTIDNDENVFVVTFEPTIFDLHEQSPRGHDSSFPCRLQDDQCAVQHGRQKETAPGAHPEAAGFENGVRVSVVPAFHRSEVERPPRTTESVREHD